VRPEDEKVILYIGGYVARQLAKDLDCEECKGELETTKPLLIDPSSCLSYTMYLDRGGLKVPTEQVLDASKIAFQVFKNILGDRDIKIAFLEARTQRPLFIHIGTKALHSNPKMTKLPNCIVCGQRKVDLLEKSLPTSCNILCNNYRKMMNDIIHSQPKKKGKSAKLKTLT
jgi:hypothetical protein